jgi:hypothetical protein
MHNIPVPPHLRNGHSTSWNVRCLFKTAHFRKGGWRPCLELLMRQTRGAGQSEALRFAATNIMPFHVHRRAALCASQVCRACLTAWR